MTVYMLLLLLAAITLIDISYMDSRTRVVLFERNEVNAIKGLSAFFVIIAHIYLNGEYQPTIGLAGDVMKIAGGALSQLGGIGVMLFFFFSGYGIEEGYGHRDVGKRYIINRIKKVYLVYIFIKCVMLIFKTIFGLASVETFFQKFIDICCIEDWFVLVIFFEYVFYYLAAKISLKNKLMLLLALNVIMGGMFFLLKMPARWYNSMWLFVVGVAFSIYQNKILELNERRRNIILSSSFLIFVGLGALFAFNKGELWCEVFKPLSGMALTILLANFLQFFHLDSPILKWGGQKSLYLYIVHLSLIEYFIGLDRVEIAVCFLVLTVIVVELFVLSLNSIAKLFNFLNIHLNVV